MRFLLPMTVLATLSACQTKAVPAPTRPAFSEVTFENKSWGRVISRWTLLADGTGSYEKGEQPGGRFSDAVVKKTPFTLTSAQLSEIDLGLALIEVQGPKTGCDRYIPDGPYGNVRWTDATGAHEAKFNHGCFEGPEGDTAATASRINAVVRNLVDPFPPRE